MVVKKNFWKYFLSHESNSVLICEEVVALLKPMGNFTVELRVAGFHSFLSKI